jgi:hypothetical protein
MKAAARFRPKVVSRARVTTRAPSSNAAVGTTMFEYVYAVSPPNLPGLNRLAARLNELKSDGEISDWHLGRWTDASKTRHVILFDNAADAAAAMKHDAPMSR